MNKKVIVVKNVKKGDLLTITKKGKVKKVEISKIKKILIKIPIINQLFKKYLNNPGKIIGIAKEDMKKGKSGTMIVSNSTDT